VGVAVILVCGRNFCLSENAYYNAKGLREEDLNEAIESFESVIRQQRQLEEDGKKCGEWSFKALKQLVKLHLRSGNATGEFCSIFGIFLLAICFGFYGVTAEFRRVSHF